VGQGGGGGRELSEDSGIKFCNLQIKSTNNWLSFSVAIRTFLTSQSTKQLQEIGRNDLCTIPAFLQVLTKRLSGRVVKAADLKLFM
jgi:hypothetical protein